MPQLSAEEQIHLLKQDFENHKEQSNLVIEELKSHLNDLDTRVKDMEMSKQKTEYQYEQIMHSLQTLNETTIPNLTAQIQELKDKPVKRYDQAVSGIIGAIFGAAGTFIANMLFKK